MHRGLPATRWLYAIAMVLMFSMLRAGGALYSAREPTGTITGHAAADSRSITALRAGPGSTASKVLVTPRQRPPRAGRRLAVLCAGSGDF